MASSSFSPLIFTLLFLATLLSSSTISLQQPFLNSAEQEAVYEVLSSIDATTPWRTLFPDDLCFSAPHGIVCDYFTEPTQPTSQNASVSRPTETVHVTELNFGFVSEFTPNPSCTSKSTINPLIFSSFKYLRKLFFYKCFTETTVSVPDISGFGNNIEELVFIENPGLVGSLSGIVGNFSRLRRLVLTGNGFYGNIPNVLGDLVTLEEVTLSRNQLSGGVSFSFAKLKKLKVLDLSKNNFDGNVPESIGYLSQLLKLDLSSNGFFGKIPDSFVNLQSLEFLDLSYNKFGNFGIPMFLSEMPRLKELYLSGNLLGGQIPEIWEKIGGISAIGFSNMGLVGNIPSSMGKSLRNLCYLGLDNNKLEGKVPVEFGLLEFANEINLENNNLSGRVPFNANFTAKVGKKLKLQGNALLCVAKEDLGLSGKNETSLGQLKLCNNPDILNLSLSKQGDSSLSWSSSTSSPEQVSLSSYLLVFLGFLFGLSSV